MECASAGLPFRGQCRNGSIPAWTQLLCTGNCRLEADPGNSQYVLTWKCPKLSQHLDAELAMAEQGKQQEEEEELQLLLSMIATSTPRATLGMCLQMCSWAVHSPHVGLLF